MNATDSKPAVPAPDDNSNSEIANFVTLAFTMVQLHLNRGRRAWFLAGMWLYRVKAKLGHGLFSAELAAYASKWDVSEKTLRRRMHFYRAVRKGLIRRYYGTETPTQIRHRLAELDVTAESTNAAEEKIAELEAVIRSTAAEALAAHKLYGQPTAATLKVEGLTATQHKFLLSAVKQLKAHLQPKKFNERVLEFFGSWAGELPAHEKAKRLHKPRLKRTPYKRPRRDSHAESAVRADQKAARKPLIFASDEDVL